MDINSLIPDKEFLQIFGDNIELYEMLRLVKEQSELTWEEISNIKLNQIDFNNHTISFPGK